MYTTGSGEFEYMTDNDAFVFVLKLLRGATAEPLPDLNAEIIKMCEIWESPDAPAYRLCTHYLSGTCKFADQCRNVHQDPDGKTQKTAAPARARSAARTASIRARRAERRAATSQPAAVQE